jgi:AcrR family transcriptional regulator
MAQYLKDHVRQAIADAGARVFAEKGYKGATMDEIARRAEISKGNLYRYYENRDALFYDVVSDEMARGFRQRLHRRMTALRSGGPDAASVYALASADLLDFCIANRLAVVVLLSRAEGSRHEGFAERTIQDLIKLAIEHFRALDPELRVTPPLRFDLDLVYRGFLGAMVRALAEIEDEATIRAVVEGYSRYHLAGLQALFAAARS